MSFNHINTAEWFKPSNLLAVTHRDGSRFYFDPLIKPRIYYPSVTTVLKDYKKKIIDNWKKRVGEEEAFKISSKARIRGDAFHSMTERYIKNEDPKLFLPEYTPQHRLTFTQARRIIDKHINNIHIQELPLLSKSLGIAGRVDLVAEWDGILSVIDFKGSNKVKPESYILDYFMQATGYAVMYWEMTKILPKQIVIVISSDDFVVKPYIKNSAKYLPALQSEISKYMIRMTE